MISQSTQIEQAIAAEHGDMLTIPEFIKATNYSIDTFLIDRFWSAIHDDMLIYVDDELIRWMGYSAVAAHTRRQNYMKLLSNKTAGVDYFDYSNDEYEKFIGNSERATPRSVYSIDYTGVYPPVDRSVGKGKTRHLLLSPKCLKSTMMQVSTPKGDQIREYYIALENLIKLYILYQTETQIRRITKEKQAAADYLALAEQEKTALSLVIAERDTQLLVERNKTISIQNFMNNIKSLEKEEYIYIATTRAYALQNQYKIGRTTNPKKRLSSYNSGRADGDNLYYVWMYRCHDSTTLERRIASLLKRWRVATNKEMYVVHYSFLSRYVEFICTRDEEEVDLINEYISTEYQSSLSLPPSSPPPLLEYDGVDIEPPLQAIAAPEPQIETIAPDTPPPPAPVIEQPQVVSGDEIMFTVKMKRSQVTELINRVLKPGLKWKDIIEELRKSMPKGCKTKFKASEWKEVILEVANERQITITRK